MSKIWLIITYGLIFNGAVATAIFVFCLVYWLCGEMIRPLKLPLLSKKIDDLELKMLKETYYHFKKKEARDENQRD